MNILKAQTEVLKAWPKEATRHNIRAHTHTEAGCVIVTPDPYHGYVIPLADILLDVGRLTQMDALWRILNECTVRDCALLDYTGIERTCDSGKRVAVYTGAYGDIGVDPKLLACFDKSARLYCREKTRPVLVVEGDKVVGFVMPCRLQHE